MPRWLDAKRVTFKYGLGAEFIGILKTIRDLGLASTTPIRVRSAAGPVEVAPRDVVAAALPDPATLGPRMTGKTCAGTYVTGTGKDGQPKAVYLYHVSDNEDTMRDFESQCVVWQTALNPVIALELLATGAWDGRRRARPGVVRRRAVPGADGEAGRRGRLRPALGPVRPLSGQSAAVDQRGEARGRAGTRRRPATAVAVKRCRSAQPAASRRSGAPRRGAPAAPATRA